MTRGYCKLEVPPVKAAVEGGMTPVEALAEEIRHEVSRRGRWVEVLLCDCTAGDRLPARKRRLKGV